MANYSLENSKVQIFDYNCMKQESFTKELEDQIKFEECLLSSLHLRC